MSCQCCLNMSKTTWHKKKTLVQCQSKGAQTCLRREISYTMLSWSSWANIAQENYLCNVGPLSTNNFVQKNNLQLLAQWWPRACRYTFTGKPSNISGGLFFNQVHYHQTILALFVQCLLRSSVTACGTTMNRDPLWLE